MTTYMMEVIYWYFVREVEHLQRTTYRVFRNVTLSSVLLLLYLWPLRVFL